MELSNKTARQMYEDLKSAPPRRKFGFGRKPIIVNVDVQSAFTLEEEYDSAYSTDPGQMEYINEICGIARSKGLPVAWCYVAYTENGHDCGVRGTRSDGPTALQNIKIGSRMAELDPRLTVDRGRDVIYRKVGASAFFQTHLPSLCVWYGVDTVIVTGGSTSGCIRSTVLDSVQHGYRTIVPEECVADVHESPHFQNLYDMAKKYADVVPVAEVVDYLDGYVPANG